MSKIRITAEFECEMEKFIDDWDLESEVGLHDHDTMAEIVEEKVRAAPYAFLKECDITVELPDEPEDPNGR